MLSSRWQWIKLCIAVAFFTIAVLSLYYNADSIKKYGFPKRSAPRTTTTSPFAKRDPAAPLVMSRHAEQPPIERQKRPAYPDRPTVAVLDFGVDRDTYLGEQTAIGISELVRQFLADDKAYLFVDRSEIARVREEHELGLFATSNPADRLELGRWLKAHLIVSGRFVDVGEPTQSLELSVVDTTTAERIVKKRVPFEQSLNSLNRVSSARVQALAEDVRSMLGEAHQRLVEARDARIVSLLFFRNVSVNDRLDHLEFTLPQRLSELAANDPEVRLVRLHDPTLAMDEQELMLIGLSAGDVDAWQRAADYYMWGLIEEQDPINPENPQNTAIQIDPQDIKVKLTLMLWHGLGDPVEVTETSAARDIDQAVERASTRAWQVVQGELPDKVSLKSRDEMISLLRESGEKLRVSTADDPDSWAVRRFMLYRDRLYLAWFLDPEHGGIGEELTQFYPATGVDQPWLYLRRSLGLVNRVIRRHGVYAYNHFTGERRQGRHINVSFWSIDRKINVLQLMYKSCEGDSRGVSNNWVRANGFTQELRIPRLGLPTDMPEDARRSVHEQIVSELISLGKEVQALAAEVPESQQSQEANRLRLHGFIDREITEMIVNLDQASPASRVEAWELWWPIIEERWVRDYSMPRELYSKSDSKVVNAVSDFFTRAGLSDRFEQKYAPYTNHNAVADHALSAGSEYVSSMGRDEQPVDYDALLREVVTLQTQHKLRPRAEQDRLKNGRREVPQTESRSDRIKRLIEDKTLPEQMRQRLDQSARLSDARYQDPDEAAPFIPKHPDAPTIDAVGLPLTFCFDKDDTAQLGGRNNPDLEFTNITWAGDRLLGIADHNQGYYSNIVPLRKRHILSLWPVGFTTQLVDRKLPDTFYQVDAVSHAGYLWLATGQEGLVRYDLKTGSYRVFTGDDGISSRHLSSLHLIGDRLLVEDTHQQLTLISELEADTPTIQALHVPFPDKAKELRKLVGVAGHCVLYEEGGGYWFDLDSGRVVAVAGWLAEHAESINASGDPVWVRASGQHFWVMYIDKLVRIDADLQAMHVWPTPIPPLQQVIIRDDGPVVWFGYSWEVPEPLKPKPVFGMHPPDKKLNHVSQVVVWLPDSGRVAGQWQVDGQITTLTSRYDKLYAVTKLGNNSSVTEYDLSRYSSALGIDNTIIDRLKLDAAAVEQPDDVAAVMDAYRGDIDALQQRKAEGRLFDEGSPASGSMLLFAAIRGGSVQTVRFLLESGVDPNSVSQQEPYYNAVILAAMKDRTDLLDLLYAYDAKLEYKSPSFGQALHAATLPRSYEAMRWLLEHDAPIDALREGISEPFDGPGSHFEFIRFRPLMIAIRQNDERAIKMLLEAGANPSVSAKGEVPPLAYAILLGHEQTVSRLLEAGANTADKDFNGLTPVSYALYIGDTKLAERLIEAGPRDKSYAPELVLAAISLGSKELVEQLLDTGIHIDTPFFDDGTMRMKLELYRLDAGTTPAAWAVYKRQFEMYDWMLNEKGINLDQPVDDHRQGDLIASAFVYMAHFDRAIDLVSKGYSIDVPYGWRGRTALMSAAERGSADEVKLLLRLGADPKLADEDGKRAIDVAKDEQVRRLLEAYMYVGSQ